MTSSICTDIIAEDENIMELLLSSNLWQKFPLWRLIMLNLRKWSLSKATNKIKTSLQC